MALDLRTVVFNDAVTDVVCLLVMLLLWRNNRRRFEGAGFWVADYALQTAAVFLIILRGRIPDALSIVLANTLVMAGCLLGLMGLERFVGKRGPQAQNFALLAAFAGVHAYFCFVRPDLTARNLNISVGLLLLCAQCLWLLLFKVDPGMRRCTLGTGLVFGAYCLVSAARIVGLTMGVETTEEYFRSGAAEAVVIIAYQMLFILLTYSLALMFNKRLLLQVRTQEEKFSKAFHSSPYAIMLTRLRDGHILDVNDGCATITGYGHTDLVGKTTLGLHLWGEAADRQAVISELAKRGLVRGKELPFRRKSGELMTGLFSAAAIVIDSQDCILQTISDITDRKQIESDREKLIAELQEALASVRQLSGMLPICASCKKIRDDKGYWSQIESYIERHSEAEFSHGLCPTCIRKLYPDLQAPQAPRT